MLAGRFGHLVPILVLAGTMGAKRKVPSSLSTACRAAGDSGHDRCRCAFRCTNHRVDPERSVTVAYRGDRPTRGTDPDESLLALACRGCVRDPLAARRQETSVAKFPVTGSYPPSGISGVIAEDGLGRRDAVVKLAKSVGSSFESFCWALAATTSTSALTCKRRGGSGFGDDSQQERRRLVRRCALSMKCLQSATVIRSRSLVHIRRFAES